MTEQMQPTTTNLSDSAVSGGDSSTVDVAKEQASSVGQGAAEAGQQVAATAKDQAGNVIAEAGGQAKDLLGQARTELVDQAGVQQQRLAAGLRALGDELHSMSQHSEQPGMATDLAKQASDRSHDAASWLDSREPGQLVQELRSFARRRPGAFLALAVGAGVLAGRMTRGVKDATGEPDDAGVTNTSSKQGNSAIGQHAAGYAADPPIGIEHAGYSAADPFASAEPAGYAAVDPQAGAEPIGYSIPPVEGTPYRAGYDTPAGSTRGTDGL
jgi:hypothetical protein